MLESLSTAYPGATWGQQRFLESDGGGLNWVGLLAGGTGFGDVTWTTASGTCHFDDYTDSTQTITYDEALSCDAILNEHSLNVGAACGSLPPGSGS